VFIWGMVFVVGWFWLGGVDNVFDGEAALLLFVWRGGLGFCLVLGGWCGYCADVHYIHTNMNLYICIDVYLSIYIQVLQISLCVC
jgi:hypothetical protein